MVGSIAQEILDGKTLESSEDWITAREQFLAEVTQLCEGVHRADRRTFIRKAIEFVEVQIRFENQAEIIGYEYDLDLQWDTVEKMIEDIETFAGDFCEAERQVPFDVQLQRHLMDMGLLPQKEELLEE